jgi:carboxymethylenebutenolidase
MVSSRVVVWAAAVAGLRMSVNSANPAIRARQGKCDQVQMMSGIIPRTGSLEHITMNTRILALALGVAACAAGLMPRVAAQVPTSDDTAKAALDKSPRHGEWVGVFDGLQNTRTFIVHPQRGGRSPFVIVLSDNRGMTDWIRAVGDQIAQEGFTALVPDLLSEAGPNAGNTESFESPAAATRAIGNLTTPQVMKRVSAVWDYGMRLPGMTGKGAVMGMGWGSVQAVSFAAEQPALSAAVVFSANPPPPAATARLAISVLGVYPGGDAKAIEQAWPTAVAFLKERTK